MCRTRPHEAPRSVQMNRISAFRDGHASAVAIPHHRGALEPMWGLVLIAAILYGVSIAGAAEGPVESVTLEEALDRAQTGNPDVVTARLQIAAAEAERMAARLYPNPSFSADFNNFPVSRTTPPGLPVGQTLITSMRLDQPLVLWGKRHLRIEGAEAGLAATHDAQRDVLRQLRAAVKIAFYDSLHDDRQLEFAQKNQQRYAQIVSLNERRFHGGDISEAEFRKIQLEQLRYVGELEDAQRQVAESSQLLGRLLGSETVLTAHGDLVAPTVAITSDDLIGDAIENRPDWAALQRQRDQAELALRLARRERYPDVTVGADYTHDEFVVSGDNRNTVGVGFSLPLPLLNQNQAEIAKAEVALHEAETDIARLRLDIAQEVHNALAAFQSARRLQQTYESGYLDGAKTTVDAAEASYRIGAASLIELLDAERTYTETQTNYLDTLFALRSGLVTLERAVGKDLGSD
jgi:outer membrane protein, heavy metal efflux system